MNNNPEKNRKKFLLKAAGVLLLIVAAGLIVYFAAFHNADVITIENGKVKDAKPTWLIAHFAEGEGEARYYKIADIGIPRGYKEDKNAEDTDGDPYTTCFVYRGKDPEKDPGILSMSPAAAGEVPAGAEAAELAGKPGMLLTEGNTAWFWMESPYPEARIAVRAELPEGAEQADVLKLLETAAEKVTPGKKLSALAADVKLNFIDDSRWTYLVNGLLVTLEITLMAVVLGVVIGTLVAAVRSTWDQNSENMRPGVGKVLLSTLNKLCKVYLTVIRGTPVVIQLMIMYYIIFSSSRNGVLIAMLAFGINSGAYVAEIIRGGIMSVDRGQLEAGRSLGFNYVKTMWFIIVPQAMKSVLPALANEFIVLLKETSVAGYVAVKDLTKGGDIIRGVTYSAFMPLIAVALIYLVMVMFFTWLVGKLERRLRSSDH